MAFNFVKDNNKSKSYNSDIENNYGIMNEDYDYYDLRRIILS